MSSATRQGVRLVRRCWTIRGQVQGVGFRPFVYRVAKRCGISGFVRNDGRGVTIQGQGTARQIEQFSRALQSDQPTLAVVGEIRCRTIPVRDEDGAFSILTSDSASADVTEATEAQVAVDAAVCPACLRELFDPADARFRYGLINCTACGPRFTIQQRIPYDRPNTTMASFAMCGDCRRQYLEPTDRRFHAQPVACPSCGPRVTLADASGRDLPGDPYRVAAQWLGQGRIVAIKGLGGFHLAVRADRDAAVQRLRTLKRRDAKPFAVMVGTIDAARHYVRLTTRGSDRMRSPASPIMLAARQQGAVVSPAVAPDNHRLGVMTPNTPIQHLLFAQLPAGCQALVMTSGNSGDEPIAIDNDEAFRRLGPLCDAFLWHNRPIERCVDDSVVLDVEESEPTPIRLARGYAPATITLPAGSDTMGLCVGGELKNTIAVVRRGDAVLSQHVGDLSHPLAFDHFRKTIDDLLRLFAVEPQWIAHDLHPGYLGTGYARELAKERGVPLIGVQHHHAHAAAVLAEHGESGPALAVVCDGMGHGDDGETWGGELLLASLTSARRLAHLRPLRLPGGDAAARDTRRCGLALLMQALGVGFDKHPATQALVPDDRERQMLTTMLRGGTQCVTSTGAGRYFDGVAAILGLSLCNQFEGQSALRLESSAWAWGSAREFEANGTFTITGEPREIDLSPLIVRILTARASGRTAQELAAWFHEGLALAWSAAVAEQASRTGVKTAALSGGVFCNEILTARLVQLLDDQGIRVLQHRRVPPNDGGLALGQAAIAAARVGMASAWE